MLAASKKIPSNTLDGERIFVVAGLLKIAGISMRLMARDWDRFMRLFNCLFNFTSACCSAECFADCVFNSDDGEHIVKELRCGRCDNAEYCECRLTGNMGLQRLQKKSRLRRHKNSSIVFHRGGKLNLMCNGGKSNETLDWILRVVFFMGESVQQVIRYNVQYQVWE